MTGLMSLVIAAGIVLVASTLTAVLMHAPLRRQLCMLCPADTAATYWMRSAVALIYLVPMYTVMSFGLPKLTYAEYTAAEIMRGTLSTTAITLALIVAAIGLRLSILDAPGKFDAPVR
jgi:hypothetical protein